MHIIVVVRPTASALIRFAREVGRSVGAVTTKNEVKGEVVGRPTTTTTVQRRRHRRGRRGTKRPVLGILLSAIS